MGAPMTNLPAVPPPWVSYSNVPGRQDGSVQVVAAGDIPCQGCQSGGSYGSTGMYLINGKVLCNDCAVKALGIQNENAAEKVRTLHPFLLPGNRG
jgi:hypothetical protein